jgi:hypothetical protein
MTSAPNGMVSERETRALVAGWFSFEEGHATAGDVEVRDMVCEVLRSLDIPYDVATAPPFGAFDWRETDPCNYSHVIFTCGPFGRAEMTLESAFLSHFHSNLRIGINLSMLLPIDDWNPFHVLLERDSSRTVRADLSFASKQRKVPVVGVCLLEPISGSLVERANAAVERLVSSREMAVVHVDTRLDRNCVGLRSPAEIESLIARLDVLITTRLHGTAFAIKMGVPVLAIDPKPGGGKISSQAKLIDWPVVFRADLLMDRELSEALDYCLSAEARRAAYECGRRAELLGAAAVDEMRRALERTDAPESAAGAGGRGAWAKADGPRTMAARLRPSPLNDPIGFAKRVRRWLKARLR